MKWLILVMLFMPTVAMAELNPCASIVAPGVINGKIASGMDSCDLGLLPNSTLIVNSGGGSSFASEGIARQIWYQGIKVRVEGRCHSACVRLLAVAESVEICAGATIGVHQASSNYGLSKHESGTREYIAFLRMTLGAEAYPFEQRIIETNHAWISYVPENEWPRSFTTILCG